MPTFRTSLLPDTSVAANFRAWAQFISNNLTSFGLVKTTDTGQVDLTTIPATSLSGTFVGYEIRRFADALQATSPLFFRIDYGVGNTTSCPAIKIQTGNGTNGAGSILNPSVAFIVAENPTSTSLLSDCLMAGDVNRFSMLLFRGIANSMLLNVERSHDSTGNDTGEYWTIVGGGYSSTGQAIHYTQRADGVGIMASNTNNLPINNLNGLGAGVGLLFGANVGILPIPPVLGYIRNPITGLWSGRATDWVDGDDVQITIYPGISHRYIVSKTGSSGFGASTSNWCAGVRFD